MSYFIWQHNRCAFSVKTWFSMQKSTFPGGLNVSGCREGGEKGLLRNPAVGTIYGEDESKPPSRLQTCTKPCSPWRRKSALVSTCRSTSINMALISLHWRLQTFTGLARDPFGERPATPNAWRAAAKSFVMWSFFATRDSFHVYDVA